MTNNNKNEYLNTDILDEIITGRVEPHIYAFITNTIPNYLKIGDTYRPLNVRINEWRKYYPDLEQKFDAKAVINEDIYFRDYAIHQYLVNDLNKERLKKDNLPNNTYYSREFFKDTDILDVQHAIDDISHNYIINSNKYDYFSIKDKEIKKHHYKRQEKWTLRPNQQIVVDNFKKAIENGRNNLLMYAVMRFGKSFTSLCCALEMKAKFVVVVSGKADVKDEWKRTVEIAGNFSDYIFLSANDLELNNFIISEILQDKNKNIVLFLTLQDLSGNNIKEKHKDLFNHKIDLLIIDESHFGARAKEYGKVLSQDLNECIYLEELDNKIKVLDAKIKLHLSGTPYRILMSNEFTKDDIIAFVQMTDIIDEKNEWDNEHLNEDTLEEWDNPYYGIPEMIRFAFNPNKSSKEKLHELEQQGISYSLSHLLETESTSKDKNFNYRKFIYEQEIMDLLYIIDGSKKDDEVLGFLDYDKIINGKMCRHMVMVLPYKSSCDAMSLLIENNKTKFKNLSEYKILNIAGFDGNYKDSEDIKRTISKYESQNIKTITLTVNRMLTGVTIPEWDTMIYLKDTSSPQEYDQAIFRLQNPYIKTIVSSNDDKKIIKQNLKPQTLLVDFSPERLFRMQEQKSLIYNVNENIKGNHNLDCRIDKEIKISPIITINHNQIKKIESADILKAVSNYNKNKSIMDEISDIPVDLSIMKDIDIRNTIEKQPIFNSKQGLIMNANKESDDNDDESHYELPDKTVDHNEKNITVFNEKNNIIDNNKIKEYSNKIRTYYQRILFFTFLTEDQVSSLDDVLEVINKTKDNIRIAKNLNLDYEILDKIRISIDPFKSNILDYKIKNISLLNTDNSMSPLERAIRSINKFSRMSESEVITPSRICNKMINLLTDEELKDIVNSDKKILDISSKSGEYAVAIYQKLTQELQYQHDQIKNIIYSIPTSAIAYEFTRKFYKILDLNIDNISSKFYSKDLITCNKEKIGKILNQNKQFNTINLDDDIDEGDVSMKFGVVIGNPPYQGPSKKQIYTDYYLLSQKIGKIVNLIFPTGWQEPKDANNLNKLNTEAVKRDKQIVGIYNYENLFEGIAGAQWTNIILWKEGYDNKLNGKQLISINDGEPVETLLLIKKADAKYLKPKQLLEFEEIIVNRSDFIPMTTITSKRKPYGLESTKQIKNIQDKKIHSDDYTILGREDKRRVTKYISKSYKIPKISKAIDSYKVFIPYAWGNYSKSYIGGAYADIIIAEPKTIATEVYLESGNFKDYETAKKHAKYLMTNFCRALLFLNKYSQHSTTAWGSIPVQDYSEDWWVKDIAEIDKHLFQKYNIPKNIEDYVMENIQVRTEENIINFRP